MKNVNIIKLASHGNDYGTTSKLVELSKPEMAFYSSAHLNQDWSSGDCNTFKKLKDHLARIPDGFDQYLQEELNCYDG